MPSARALLGQLKVGAVDTPVLGTVCWFAIAAEKQF